MRCSMLFLLAVSVVHPACAVEAADPKPDGNRANSPASPAPVSPSQHLAQVFAQVARENRGAEKDHVRYYSSSWGLYQHFESWSLHGDMGSSLRRSLALERLALDLGPNGRLEQQAEAYIEAAARMWDDPDPKRRALAAEFLAMLPSPALESGLIERLAPLLGDTSIAWKGMGKGGAQWGQIASVGSVDVSVADVARATFSTLTPFGFSDAETFRRWWQANREVRAHPWYWSIRWRRVQPEADLALLDRLGPDEGLRMLLLASNHDALLAEARLSAGPQLEMAFNASGSGSPLATALFVRKHGLSSKLLDLLEGKIDWPEAREPQAIRMLSHVAIEALEETIVSQDLPRLKQLVQTPKGVFATEAGLLLVLTRVAMRWLPSDHEQILVSLVQDVPSRHGLAVELLEETGMRHWDLIKRSYRTAPVGYQEERNNLIRSAPLVTGEKARQCLAELLAEDDLDVVDANRDARQLRFQAFVEAVNMHAHREIVSVGELDGAIYHSGKGGDRRPAEAIAAVRENRRTVLGKLRKFLDSDR